jgi:hypothetical protein
VWADDGQPTSWPQRAAEVGERGLGVLEEHRPELADHRVEALFLEGMGLGVGVDELDVADAGRRGPPAGERDQRGADVDADRRARGRHGLGGLPGGGALAQPTSNTRWSGCSPAASSIAAPNGPLIASRRSASRT